MATLHIQNLPDDLYQKLQNLATTQNHSIRAQVITLLETALQAETQQLKVETLKSRHPSQYQ